VSTDIANHVYAALLSAGLKKNHVRALMPDWWGPTLAESEAGQWEFALLAARRLSLDVTALAAGRLLPTGAFSEPRFKHTARLEPESLRAATMIASSLAHAVITAMPQPSRKIPAAAGAIREQLVELGKGDPGFDALLEYCWQCGIPVIAIPSLPTGIRKMDAAALSVNGKPAIIIAKKSDSKAWLAFLLAHELGHIVHHHVPVNGAIVEGSITDTIEFNVDHGDDQEVAATQFAIDILGGPGARDLLATWPRGLMPVNLAAASMGAAKQISASPGSLILQYGYLNGQWREAQQALNFLRNEKGALKAITSRLNAEIDPDKLGDDLQGYLSQITGAGARQ
jgi:hypothetical protein